MVRVALLLFIAAALVVLVLSNFSPIALNILGTTTQALPLGVWVVVAIFLGGLTTLLIAGLIRLGRSASGSTRPKRPANRTTDRTTMNSFRAPWAGTDRPTDRPTGSTGTSSYASSSYASSSYTSSTTGGRVGDDWETSQHRDDWNDWGEAPDLADRQTTPYSDTQVRDTEDEVWANWDGYEDVERGNRSPSDEFDEFDDEVIDRPNPPQDSTPRRTDFETKQEPETQRQSGSVYSVSYRRSDGSSSPLPPPPPPPPPPPRNPPPPKSGDVYDAEYRVITPPLRPDPEEIQPPSPQPPSSINDDDEDWGLDDDDEFGDRPRS